MTDHALHFIPGAGGELIATPVPGCAECGGHLDEPHRKLLGERARVETDSAKMRAYLADRVCEAGRAAGDMAHRDQLARDVACAARDVKESKDSDAALAATVVLWAALDRLAAAYGKTT